MSGNNTTLEATRKQRQEQVRQQYLACSFLAQRFAKMCDQLSTTVHLDQQLGILDHMGESSAEWMETMGDIMNNADACNDETEWLDPIFDAAQKMFPVASRT